MPSAHASKRRDLREPGPAPALGPPTILVQVDRCEPHPDNPRDEFGDDDPELLALVESLKTTQLINAIHVEEIDRRTERYRILAGERRWRAAKLAGWTTIPAVVCRLSRPDALRLMADENMARSNLNHFEMARMIQQLIAPVEEGGAGMNQREVARRLGPSKSTINNYVGLLRLPENWRGRLLRGEIGFQAAIRLAVHVHRADVLAAVELDFANHPERWDTSDKFVQQLKAVVACFDSLIDNSQPEASDSAARPAAEAAPGQDDRSRTLRPLIRRSAPVVHGLTDESAACDDATPPSAARAELPGEPPAADQASDELPSPQSAAAAVAEAETAADRDLCDGASVEAILTRVFDLLDGLDVDSLRYVQRYLLRRARGTVGPAARDVAALSPGRRDERPACVLTDDLEAVETGDH